MVALEKRENLFVPQLWIRVWLALSSLICTLDVLFTTLRPRTLRPNQWASTVPWLPWHIYCGVDMRYADAADAVTNTTGPVMLVEIALNVFALAAAKRRSIHSSVAALVSSCLVFWKTIIYVGLFVAEHGQHFVPGTNRAYIILIFWIPNGIWLVVPLLVIVSLWRGLEKLANSGRRKFVLCDGT